MKVRLSGLMGAALLVCMILIPASYVLADGDSSENHTLVLTPKAGDPVGVVPPGEATGGGGFTGNLYIVPKEKWTGTFTTNIISGEIDIFGVIAALQMPGAQVSVEKVRGVFTTPFGTICDEHEAVLTALPLAPIFYENGLVIDARADGEITGGAMAYNKATGNTHLALMFEVSPSGPPLARSGTFTFEFRHRPSSSKSCQ